MSKTLHRTLQAKMAALEGPEWDSSDEEGAAPVTQKKKLTDKKLKPKTEKTKKTATRKEPQQPPKEDDKKGGDEDDLVLYIGHLPKEFEEQDLNNFLSQFGKVRNCRISRKIETGNSRGYAFVRFDEKEVCQIVCDTLHGYFLGRQRLVCQIRPAQRGMFYNTDTVIQRHIQQKQLEKKKRNRNLANAEKLKEITARLVSREQKKRKQLEAMGIEYDFPGYKKNHEALQIELNLQEQDGGKKKNEENEADKKSRKRSDSIGSEGSLKKKKKKRKESIDSVESASKRPRKDSVESVSNTKKSKRKESIESVSSETKLNKKTRKDSIDSEGSAKRKKKKDSESSQLSLEETEEKSKSTKMDRLTQSGKKAKKSKKDKKRRQSAP
ncbi:RNA-binding protein RNP-2 [Nitzschia inconspicua]|uniref:RNA-binding protein RNP-2 n=1 Tax=Nitzschia inconspicua TaxID=303405 RepID=A0A9K3PLU7_9STRA|nr:RNA-binding protein RNP-2 [Nitzschia inconspicua]